MCGSVSRLVGRVANLQRGLFTPPAPRRCKPQLAVHIFLGGGELTLSSSFRFAKGWAALRPRLQDFLETIGRTPLSL